MLNPQSQQLNHNRQLVMRYVKLWILLLTPDSSDSLNELMTKLNQYLGPHTVPDCEKKIGKLKEILNILDNDAKENPSANMQIDANTMKTQGH